MIFAPFTLADGDRRRIAAHGARGRATPPIGSCCAAARPARSTSTPGGTRRASGKAPARRVVKVKLLAADHATVVMSWRFRNVRPVSLSYSPLQAMDGSVLMETLELAFDAVEMS